MHRPAPKQPGELDGSGVRLWGAAVVVEGRGEWRRNLSSDVKEALRAECSRDSGSVAAGEEAKVQRRNLPTQRAVDFVRLSQVGRLAFVLVNSPVHLVGIGHASGPLLPKHSVAAS
jgi:hypothetical protein